MRLINRKREVKTCVFTLCVYHLLFLVTHLLYHVSKDSVSLSFVVDD
jgi:hypothetical protein